MKSLAFARPVSPSVTRIAIAAFLTGTVLLMLGAAPAQPPVAAAGRGGRGAGRGAAAPASPEVAAAMAQMSAALTAPTQALVAARAEVLPAALAWPRDKAALQAKVDAVKAAELALAKARADAFAKVQASAEKIPADQIPALAAALTVGGGGGRGGAGGGGGGGGGRGGVPNMTSTQVDLLTQMTGIGQKLAPQVNATRSTLVAVSLAQPRDDAAITAAVDKIATAELALATARGDLLEKIQNSPNKLSPAQITGLINSNAAIVSGNFDQPRPMDFNDHEGYISLFDGKTLKGWDGHPKFWRVEDGAIVGESTAQNPSGNSYIAYRDIEAKDFTLKFEIKVDGAGGSGMQYRSKTGIPWLTAIAPNVTANAGPVNLDWMMTGPQADFWPSRDTVAQYTGQFYSENTPMRIMAWRGQVVEGHGMEPRRLMGTIGDRLEMAKYVKINDWNQYTVIARGPTFIHIVNGQLMSVMIDDDPASSNNQSGLIGLEIEAITKLYVRNIWLKKIN